MLACSCCEALCRENGRKLDSILPYFQVWFQFLRLRNMMTRGCFDLGISSLQIYNISSVKINRPFRYDNSHVLPKVCPKCELLKIK